MSRESVELAEGGEPYRGHDGVRTWWEESFSVVPALCVEIDAVRDLGDNVQG